MNYRWKILNDVAGLWMFYVGWVVFLTWIQTYDSYFKCYAAKSYNISLLNFMLAILCLVYYDPKVLVNNLFDWDGFSCRFKNRFGLVELVLFFLIIENVDPSFDFVIFEFPCLMGFTPVESLAQTFVKDT